MKNALQLFMMALMVLFIFGCGGTKDFSKTHPSQGKEETKEDIFYDLRQQCAKIIRDGGIAAVGIGVSAREDIAEDMAKIDGQSELAQILENKIAALQKNFVEQIGGGNNPQINQTFTKVQKSVASSKLSGAFMLDSKIAFNSTTGVTRFAALMVIDPKMINTSILDEIKSSDDKLYQQFRSTKGFEELQKEIENYEKNK